MKKAFLPAVLLVLVSLVAGCGTPPPLVSQKYLNDNSLISEQPCGAPCFQDITVGQTTFADALSKVRANTLFKDVQSQDDPPQAAWATADGEPCCQMTANKDTGLVDAILLRVAPVMTVADVIAKYGEPEYVSVLQQDYTPEEAAIGLVYPKQGNVLWVMPGNAESTIDETDPVVIVLYLNPQEFDTLIETASLSAWEGYKALSEYRQSTPVVTPKYTLTPVQ